MSTHPDDIDKELRRLDETYGDAPATTDNCGKRDEGGPNVAQHKPPREMTE